MFKIDKEFYEIIAPIINSPEYQKRKNFPHHGKLSVYNHSFKVSKLAYLISKNLNYDYKSSAIAGLLHDLYTSPWQNSNKKKPLLMKHGFVHAKEALDNAKKFYPQYLNSIIENAIERHMFPLNLIPPKYKEAWVVTMADKIASANVLINPKILLSILGLKVKERNDKDE